MEIQILLSKIQQIVKLLFKNSDNRIEQSGSNNLAVQGISDSTLTIINISDPHYENWKQQLETEKKYYERLNEEETEERVKISRNISILVSQINEYEKQILILAEEINRKNNFKSKRLDKARELIQKGNISEAREFYRSKVSEIEEDEKDILDKRRGLAEEYLILGILTQTDYYNPNLFEETLKYFKKSLDIHENKDNLTAIAHFLQKYNRFNDSKEYYERALEKCENDFDLLRRATVHNNLGNAYACIYNISKAEYHLTISLNIKRELATENPSVYLKDVALTLGNLANIHLLKLELGKAESEYNEALKIRQELFKGGDEYQKFHVADVLMALGILNSDIAQEQNDDERFIKAIEYFEQALKTYESLTQDKNFVAFHVAVCLNHLGLVYQRRKDLKKALKFAIKAKDLFEIIVKADPAYLPQYANSLGVLGAIKCPLQKRSAIEDFHQALEIFENLEKTSPKAFLPDIGIILNNIAIYYQNCFSYRNKSIEYAVESIVVLAPYLESKPRLTRYYNLSMKVLQNWNLSKDEINSLIQEKGKNRIHKASELKLK